MRELYTRDEHDPNYKVDQLETNDEIDALTVQIRMSLGTNNGEVLGESQFGCDLDALLFSTNFYSTTFNSVVVQQLQQYSELAQDYPISVVAYDYPLTEYKSAVLIDVAVNEKSLFGLLM